MERYEITLDNDNDMLDSDGMQMEGRFLPIYSSIAPTDQTSRLKSSVTKRKGRGFSSAPDTVLPAIHQFDTITPETSGNALRSVEGWVLFITGLHEEVTEEDLLDKLSDYGPVRDLKLNLDHRTGYVKGYALVEYAEYGQAQRAVQELNASQFMDGELQVDFCFVNPPSNRKE
jgi:RNA-binding protein 8A